MNLASPALRGLVLAIDASTYTGTVAVLRDGAVLSARETAMRGEKEERLMPAVAEALHDAGVQPDALAAVVCGEGPGSFTSLRIAASIAKGIAHATAKPLFAVSSLALAVGARPRDAGACLAVLDALRGEYYAELLRVDANGVVRGAEPPRLVSADALESEAARLGAVLVNASASRGDAPRADAVARLAPESFLAVDLVSWEPSYGRVAEAQARWEAAHGRPLPAA